MHTIVRILAVALFLVSTTATSVSAQSAQIILGINDPSQRTTRTDIERFIDSSRNLSIQQVQTFYRQLNPDQQKVAKQIVQERLRDTRVPPELQASKPPPATIAAPSGTVTTQDGHGDCVESGGTECWEQVVEYTDAQPRVVVTTWYADQYSCDDEGWDTEYIFYIPVGLNRDPDGARWNTTNGALWTFTGFGGAQPGFGYSYSEIRLCISDRILAQSGLNGPGAAASITGRYR